MGLHAMTYNTLIICWAPGLIFRVYIHYLACMQSAKLSGQVIVEKLLLKPRFNQRFSQGFGSFASQAITIHLI